MQISTGNYVEATDLDDAMRKLGTDDPNDVVMVDGNLIQVQELGERVRLGSDVKRKRAARRKSQRASRKANRPKKS